MASSETSNAADSLIWGRCNEKILIDIMVDQVNKGTMEGEIFRKPTWKTIVEELNAKTKRRYNLKQVKQKFHRLRARYREFSALLRHGGFRWDFESNSVRATEETWQSYLRANPKGNQFKKKGCDHYKLLGIIFNKSNGSEAFHASIQDPPTTDDEQALLDDIFTSGTHVDPDLSSPLDPNLTSPQETVSSLGLGKRSPGRENSGVERKRMKENGSVQMGAILQAWAEVSKARAEITLSKAEQMRSRSVEANSTVVHNESKDDFSISKCIGILNEIEEVDDDTYMNAVEKFRDIDTREIFACMLPEKRRIWLARMV